MKVMQSTGSASVSYGHALASNDGGDDDGVALTLDTDVTIILPLSEMLGRALH